MNGPFAQALNLLVSGDREVWFITGTSLRFGLSSTLIACVPAIPLGVLIALKRFRLRRPLLAVLNTLMALWLFERFGLSLAAAGTFFFWAGLFTAVSQLAAPAVARRIGLVNTMVFTHIPANLALLLAALAPSLDWALALLLIRALLSQMEVPTRAAFVMAVVTPPERTAAASFTAVPRSLASAASPALGGALFAAGWLAAPLVASGLLKIGYDFAVWYAFRRMDPTSR